MSNQIELISIDSEKQAVGLYDTDGYHAILEATSAIPTLWMFLYREADLKYVALCRDDDEFSLLITRKAKALQQLKEAVANVAQVSAANLTEHAKYFAQFLRSKSCPGKFIALPGPVEWVTTESRLLKALRFFDRPTKKGFPAFVEFFKHSRHLQPPPTRAEMKNGIGRERAACYHWIFGTPAPKQGCSRIPWQPSDLHTRKSSRGVSDTVLSRERKWVDKNEDFLGRRPIKEIREVLKDPRADKQYFELGSDLQSLGRWTTTKAHVAIAEGVDSGWASAADGYAMERAAFLMELWRPINGAKFICVLEREVTRLLLLASLYGDTKFEKLCITILQALFRPPFGEYDLQFFLAMACHAKVRGMKLPKAVTDEVELAPIHQEVLDKWDKQSVKQPLLQLLESGFDFELAPLDVAWILKQRERMGLRNPKLDHPYLTANPILQLPGSKLPKAQHQLVDDCIACLKRISPRKSAILHLQAPVKLILRKSNLEPKPVTCDWK